MTQIFGYSILGFILAVGILTMVHEFGHFWVARRCGVKVLRFSIGFGKPILSWYDKQGTEYVIGWLPVGGYVHLLGEQDANVAPNEKHLTFSNKSLWAKVAILLAGPLANLLLAFLAYWIILISGVNNVAPVLGMVPNDSPAYTAGLRKGQEIVTVNGRAVHSWDEVVVSILNAQHDIDLNVIDIETGTKSLHHLSNIENRIRNAQDNILHSLGFVPFDIRKPLIGTILPDSIAEREGLRAGDLIISLDGIPVDNLGTFMQRIATRYNHTIELEIMRGTQTINYKFNSGNSLGIQFAVQPLPANMVRTVKLDVLAAIPVAWSRTVEFTRLTVESIAKMFTGNLSMQYIAGPLSIAEFAGISVVSGFDQFLNFLALLSISLAVINLLPLPILDGGNIVLNIIEAVRRKKFSTKFIATHNFVGVVIISSLMVFALFNDVVRILS